MKTCVITFSILIASCSGIPIGPPLIPTETTKPTRTPLPTSTNTPTPTKIPTSTPTPTPVPTPDNLNLDKLYEYETIDPYEFFIEKRGYMKSIIAPSMTYERLNKESGDEVTGNKEDGWYITYQGLTVYYGPGVKNSDGNIIFELGVGEKDDGGNIDITERKKYEISEDALFLVCLMRFWPGPPIFIYNPTTSSFVLGVRKNQEQDYSFYPAYSSRIIIVVTKDKQILPIHDYESYPHLCVESTGKELWPYKVEGKLIYWGTTPEGEIKCPIFKEIIEE